MTQNQYQNISETAQLHTLEQKGAWLAERIQDFYHIRLYQVDNFYVELYRHTHFNVIVQIKTFTNTELLAPYLQDIDIAPLLSAIGL